MAAAFCCRILRAAAQEGRKGFFSAENLCAGFCGKLARRILREARGLLFFRAAYWAGRFCANCFLRFTLKHAAISSGAWLPCGGVVFFASLCLLRGSLLGGCAQCAMRRVKICAQTFFRAIFLRLAPRRNESWRNFNLMACGCARRFSSPPFGCNLHGAHGRFWNNFADFFAGFFFAPILHFALFCANCTIIMGVAAYCNRLAPF